MVDRSDFQNIEFKSYGISRDEMITPPRILTIVKKHGKVIPKHLEGLYPYQINWEVILWASLFFFFLNEKNKENI